jgi:hypothetical protein
MRREYKSSGFQYSVEQVGKGDNYHLVHRVKNLETLEIEQIDFTPYCFMTRVDFENYISLNRPKRPGINALSADTLRRMVNKQIKV